MSENLYSVLLIEDNPDHVELIRRAITSGPLKIKLTILSDGEDALNFIFRKGKYKTTGNRPIPDLILLDIKLPKVDGYEILRLIKTHAKLKSIPIIVLTTSARKEDIERMYQYGANSYIIKPSQYHEFVALYEKIESFCKQRFD